MMYDSPDIWRNRPVSCLEGLQDLRLHKHDAVGEPGKSGVQMSEA